MLRKNLLVTFFGLSEFDSQLLEKMALHVAFAEDGALFFDPGFLFTGEILFNLLHLVLQSLNLPVLVEADLLQALLPLPLAVNFCPQFSHLCRIRLRFLSPTSCTLVVGHLPVRWSLLLLLFLLLFLLLLLCLCLLMSLVRIYETIFAAVVIFAVVVILLLGVRLLLLLGIRLFLF